MEDCIQTNIPTVNEDAPACGEFIKEQCVIFTEGVSDLGLPENVNLKLVVAELVYQIKTMKARIKVLEEQTPSI